MTDRTLWSRCRRLLLDGYLTAGELAAQIARPDVSGSRVTQLLDRKLAEQQVCLQKCNAWGLDPIRYPKAVQGPQNFKRYKALPIKSGYAGRQQSIVQEA